MFTSAYKFHDSLERAGQGNLFVFEHLELILTSSFGSAVIV
jgi:hypothetical protein